MERLLFKRIELWVVGLVIIIGLVAGALMGGIVWQHGGIWATCWLSGGLTLMGLLCFACGFKGSENSGT